MFLAIAPYHPVQIVPGQCIAQALSLPMNVQFPALSHSRGPTSTGSADIFLGTRHVLHSPAFNP